MQIGALQLPDQTKAILSDLDGVLIDSAPLTEEFTLNWLEQNAAAISEGAVEIGPQQVWENWHLPVPEYWHALNEQYQLQLNEELLQQAVDEHQRQRAEEQFEALDGLEQIFRQAKENGVLIAVVSNNEQQIIEQMIPSALQPFVQLIVGTGHGAPKPAPDLYQYACRELDVPADQAVVLEDSLPGAEAGSAAGCYVVGVATGIHTFSELSDSEHTDRVYAALLQSELVLDASRPKTEKVLITAYDFLSHMVEHIAWRLGVAVELNWYDDDWRQLGRQLSDQLNALSEQPLADSSSAFCGIDDTVCKLNLQHDALNSVSIQAYGLSFKQVQLLPVEQLPSAQPMIDLLEGFAERSGYQVQAQISNFLDPHHGWEALFRAFGEGLRQLSGIHGVRPPLAESYHPPKITVAKEVVEVHRQTAESECDLTLKQHAIPDGESAAQLELNVSRSLPIGSAFTLFDELCRAANLKANFNYSELGLSSSHVMMEDCGLAFGLALGRLAHELSVREGIKGYGQGEVEGVHVALSLEGRKSFKMIGDSYDSLRDQLLIGHTLIDGSYSEDLDDFFDGVSNGALAGLVITVQGVENVDHVWHSIYHCAGLAIADMLQIVEANQGLIAGVKASSY